MPVLYMNLREFIVGTLDEWELDMEIHITIAWDASPSPSNGGHPEWDIHFFRI